MSRGPLSHPEPVIWYLLHLIQCNSVVVYCCDLHVMVHTACSLHWSGHWWSPRWSSLDQSYIISAHRKVLTAYWNVMANYVIKHDVHHTTHAYKRVHTHTHTHTHWLHILYIGVWGACVEFMSLGQPASSEGQTKAPLQGWSKELIEVCSSLFPLHPHSPTVRDDTELQNNLNTFPLSYLLPLNSTAESFGCTPMANFLNTDLLG